MPIRIAIVGVGKIAKDQHLPALGADPDFELAALVTRHAAPTDVPTFATLDELIASAVELDAISFCTPPQGRHALARMALEAGYHVMLEKPPGVSVSEIHDLAAIADAKRLSLFATWHSREAPAVAPARAWLRGKQLRSVRANWKENVRIWHPGQTWIWEPGGLGVFDPGINALSILTLVLPHALFLTRADLHFPANRAAPIAAELDLTDTLGTPIRAEFDFRQTGPQIWEMLFDTDGGTLHLSGAGGRLEANGETLIDATRDWAGGTEYPGLYRHFAGLIGDGCSDVDLSPFQLTADAFMLGRRHEVEAFIE
jgi:D-galactose 1-dehydrogenase